MSLEFEMDEGLIRNIENTIQEYADNPTSRDRIVMSIAREHSFDFIQYADYAATYAVRLGNPELIKRGILSLAVENNTFDYRDSITRLVLLNYSAIKLGLDPDKIFQGVMSIAPQKFAGSLRSFIGRSSEDRALSTFGFREEYTPLFTYVRVPIHLRNSSGLRSRIRRKLRKLVPFL